MKGQIHKDLEANPWAAGLCLKIEVDWDWVCWGIMGKRNQLRRNINAVSGGDSWWGTPSRCAIHFRATGSCVRRCPEKDGKAVEAFRYVESDLRQCKPVAPPPQNV